METIADRLRNPFGLDMPCDEVGGRGDPVHGYGDPNADFHVVGDHPGRHGGAETGVPFTGSDAARRVQGLLHAAGFLEEPYSDRPRTRDLYTSYLYACLPQDDGPTPSAYAAAERYFDAEFRAVNAHVIVPLGEAAVRHVLETYTSRARKLEDVPLTDLHAAEIRGTGFMVLPATDPVDWDDLDRFLLRRKLRDVRSRDYRQTKGVATRVG